MPQEGGGWQPRTATRTADWRKGGGAGEQTGGRAGRRVGSGEGTPDAQRGVGSEGGEWGG